MRKAFSALWKNTLIVLVVMGWILIFPAAFVAIMLMVGVWVYYFTWWTVPIEIILIFSIIQCFSKDNKNKL